jgi:tetratricopeptide (TPR) repeat protein
MAKQETIGASQRGDAALPPAAMARRLEGGHWLLAVMILIFTVLAYQSVWRAGFVWDDGRYVTENPALRSLDGLRGIWSKPGTTIQYYPLVFTSFWAEYHLWKLQPLGYHLVNVLLHALNAVLLWRVLRRLEIPGAWWAAAIFALHPVMVESVAWITERKNVLSCLFYLLAVLAYLRFRPLTSAGMSGTMAWRFYPLVVGLFLCALLSKTVTCSLPAILLLLVWWKTGRVEKRDALPLAPLFVLGAALGLMTVGMEKRAGAVGGEWALSFVQRCLVAGRALWFYAGKLFWPRQFTFIYPHWKIDSAAAWQYVFPVAALAVLLALWLFRHRIGRGPVVAVLCFAGTLTPALGFFDVFPFRYSYVADHFQYMASIGLMALAVGAGATILQRAGRPGRALGALIGTVVLLMLGASTWGRASVYRDSETLWRDTLAKNPNAWLADNNLSIILLQKGRVEEAMRHCEEAVRIKPDYALAHGSLGNALFKAGRIQDAIQQYQLALQLEPGLAEAHYNLGNAFFQAGKMTDAIWHYEQELQIQPDSAKTHKNLGTALVQVGRIQDGTNHFEQALRIKPDDDETHFYLGLALSQLGKTPAAMEHYEQVLRIKPDHAEAENNLAWLLATVPSARGGDPVRAVTLAQQACQRTGNRLVPYLDTLAVAYAAAGRFDDATTTAERAIELARSNGQARLINELSGRLELFRNRRVYRESANVAKPDSP